MTPQHVQQGAVLWLTHAVLSVCRIWQHLDHCIDAMRRKPARPWDAYIHARVACPAVCVHRSSNQPLRTAAGTLAFCVRSTSITILGLGSCRSAAYPRTRAHRQAFGVWWTNCGPARGSVGRRPLGRSLRSTRAGMGICTHVDETTARVRPRSCSARAAARPPLALPGRHRRGHRGRTAHKRIAPHRSWPSVRRPVSCGLRHGGVTARCQ